MEQHPRLDLKISHDLSRRITEDVISLRIDIGLVVNPVRHPDLVIRKLCSDQVRFWTGPGRRHIQDTTGDGAVLICDPDLVQTQALLKRARQSGITFGRVIDSSNLEVISQLVTAGCGIGILPSRVALRIPQSKLKPIEDGPVYEDEICMIFRVENRNVRAVQMIVECISKAFRQSQED